MIVAFGAPAAPSGDVEEQALTLLRRTMPLTAGQLVAAGAEPGEAVRAALVEGRPIEPALVAADSRPRRLAEARAAAERSPEELPFLAREYESARG